MAKDEKKPVQRRKFMPKAPPRREQKLVLPKQEKVEEIDEDDKKVQELLMKRLSENAKKPKFIKPEIKAPQPRVSSFSFGPAGLKSEGGDAATSDMGIKDYKDPWDYGKYYPVTLPIREPFSGNPELLDEQEFKADSEIQTLNDSSSNAAEELGLMNEDLEKKLFYIQLPPTLPLLKHYVKPEDSGTASSSKPDKASEPLPKGCSLNELPAGFMGKMLVYKSGAVKLKLGDHLYDVSGGLDCSFAQDVVAIHTEEKSCCNIGELNKRVIITPDIDSVLDGINEL